MSHACSCSATAADQCGAHIGWAQARPHRAHVITRLQPMRGECMAQHRRTGRLFICAGPKKIHAQPLFLSTQNRRFGREMDRRRNLPAHRQVRQKCRYLRTAHILLVALALKQDKTPCPIHISRLGVDAVVARAQVITQPIQQFGCRGTPSGTTDAEGAALSEDDDIREILGLPKCHRLGTIPMYRWMHLVLAD